MANRGNLHRSWPHGLPSGFVPHLRLGGLVLLAAAPLLAVAALVPRALFLPSISLTAIAAAATVSFAAWWFGSRRHSNTITLWDVAGACALIGCAAAMLSEPEVVLNTIGKTSEP